MLSAKEITSITATVAKSLDVSLPLYRKSTVDDGYGHSTGPYPATPTGTIACNIIKPGASLLQSYAEVIGSQRSIMLRVMQTTDLREGDRVRYDGLNWLVQNLLDAESYTVTKEFLVTTIA